ncbi:MAG: hypothetical protein ACLPJH_01735 [Myxococcaceae bacterium]
MAARPLPWVAAPLGALLLAGCAHAPDEAPAQDVLEVTELAARYALEHDVPPVLREPAAVCLEVDGQPPPPEVLSRLARSGLHVTPGAAGCAGPRAVLLQVRDVAVAGDHATAWAGVRLGRNGPLTLRKVQGQWQLLRPAGPTEAGPQLTFPLGS